MSAALEWFTRRDTLRALRETQPSPEAEQWFARAREAARLADRAREAGVGSALTLYAEAVHFALAARDGALCATPAEQCTAAAEPLPTELEQARSVTAELIAALEQRAEPLVRARFERVSRIAALIGAVTLIACLSGYWALERSRGVDLAAGKPWRASSAMPGCPLGEGRMCFGYRTDIFFHTKNEAGPWIVFDLGAPETFSRALIVNRSDCCRDSAAPLMLEVSDDGENFRRVSGRRLEFSRILLKFPPQTARYVRISVLKQTALHLERVSIYR